MGADDVIKRPRHTVVETDGPSWETAAMLKEAECLGAYFPPLVRKVDEPAGTLYMLWAVGSTFFKIGYTTGPVDDRARAIEGSCPFPLRIVGTVLANRGIESLIHRRLQGCRIHREWFSLSEPMMWSLLRWFGRQIPAGVPEAVELITDAHQSLRIGSKQ